jgi:hypothetical protein
MDFGLSVCGQDYSISVMVFKFSGETGSLGTKTGSNTRKLDYCEWRYETNGQII